jgi:hypothetical protein
LDEGRLKIVPAPQALILRTAGGGVSKDEGDSSVHWILLRDSHFVTSSG